MTAAVSPLRADGGLLSPAVALSFIARAVNSSLQLDEVLRTVVRVTCEVLDADRATILLLDDKQRLVPSVSHGRVEDPEGLARFRQMPPLPVALIPDALDVLSRPEALIVPDVTLSPFVPKDWKEAFGLTSLLLSPIVADGVSLGALVVDYTGPRPVFTTNEVVTVEGIAACTSTALRNARLYDDVVQRARSLDESLRVTADLNAAATTRGVLDVALDGFLRVLAGQQASLHLFEGCSLATVATRGGQHPEPGSAPLAPDDRDAIAAWPGGLVDATKMLSEIPAFSRLPAHATNLLLPLTDPPFPGFVVVSCAHLPDAEPWRVARSVAGQVTLALDRARLTEQLQRRLEHVETSYRLADELALAPDLDTVVARLARPVRLAAACEVIDIFLCATINSERFESRPAGKQLNALMRRWLKSPPSAPVEVGGLMIVPMMLESELVGVLRLRPSGKRPGPAESGFLLAIAAAVAGVVSRADLSARVSVAQRELTVVQERERIARDLHDTLGQTLFGLGLQLADCAKSTSDEPLRSRLIQAHGATDAAAVQLRQAIHALAFLQKARPSLASSLRALVRELPSELHTTVRATGRSVPLAPAPAEALLRVAREALVNVARHSRATDVCVLLKFQPDCAELVISDNGVGLGQRTGVEGGGLHFGIRSMQRRLGEVGGGIRFENLTPHGLQLTARIPLP